MQAAFTAVSSVTYVLISTMWDMLEGHLLGFVGLGVVLRISLALVCGHECPHIDVGWEQQP